jgi:hypothetical protein
MSRARRLSSHTGDEEVQVRIRRTITASVLAITVLGGTSAVALGHECIIANRSAQGDAGSLHSGVWQRLTLADIFGFIHGAVGGPALTPEQIDWAVAEAASQGLPADGWVTNGKKTIGEGSGNPNLADGRGLDHLSIAFGEQIVGIYFEALGQ